MISRRLGAGLALLLAVAWPAATAGQAAAAEDDVPLSLHVAGNRLVNGVGRPVRLLGVNRSGTESACIRGAGVLDGPSDEASVHAIASWHANTVRLPLNEDCWLGINGASPATSGAAYRRAISDYALLVNRSGLFVELSLAWVAPGDQQSTAPLPMPDADHAPQFWRSVAAVFRDVPGVLFGVYGEPHDISWDCWRNGGGACGTGYAAAGMQSLVDAIRGSGARQPIALSGIGWGNDVSSWWDHRLRDNGGGLIAEVHAYPTRPCHDLPCWRRTILPLTTRVPVVAGEVGEDDCRGSFLDAFLPFAQRVAISFLAWTWEASGRCTALITSYGGTPTAYGFVYREHLTAAAVRAVPNPPAPASRAASPPWNTGAVAIVGLIGAVLTVLVLVRARLRGRLAHP